MQWKRSGNTARSTVFISARGVFCDAILFIPADMTL
jgi:hypothetical protein